jgi:hypothetical protein
MPKPTSNLTILLNARRLTAESSDGTHYEVTRFLNDCFVLSRINEPRLAPALAPAAPARGKSNKRSKRSLNPGYAYVPADLIVELRALPLADREKLAASLGVSANYIASVLGRYKQNGKVSVPNKILAMLAGRKAKHA